MSRGQTSFFWKLFTANALLLIGVVATCVWLILAAFDDFYSRELSNQLRTHAHLLQSEIGDRFDTAHAAELDALAKSIVGTGSAMRITFVGADGTVLGDSRADPAKMESHAGREEIMTAMQDRVGESTRWSTTVEQDMKYVAVRVGHASKPLGVVRVSMPVVSIVARTQSARALFWRIALVVLAAAVVLALGLAKTWSGRIARVTETARSLSRGDLSATAAVGGADEVALLARSLDRMRDNLAAHLQTIDGQRSTLEYLLTQLHEGVVVADPEGDIIVANPAAARLLNIPAGHADADRGLPTAVPDAGTMPPRIVEMLRAEEHADVIVEGRITVKHPDKERTLLARASNIVLPAFAQHDPTSGEHAGRLLVLTDITELTHAIQVKADFVANASHELRTPLSAIRAAVETLLSIDLAVDAQSAKSLLSVIDRHSERLGLIVADLLDLSSIESAATRFEAQAIDLPEAVAELRGRFENQINDEQIRWSQDLDPDCPSVRVNRQLFNLVLDNLVDNAIKFTDTGGLIRISARKAEGRVTISVADDGCGIAPQEQARVFERFYQVERARSGGRRGSGLGLAIVRHAVNAMGGRIDLTSAPGEGTRMDIHIPQASGAFLAAQADVMT